MTLMLCWVSLFSNYSINALYEHNWQLLERNWLHNQCNWQLLSDAPTCGVIYDHHLWSSYLKKSKSKSHSSVLISLLSVIKTVLSGSVSVMGMFHPVNRNLRLISLSKSLLIFNLTKQDIIICLKFLRFFRSVLIFFSSFSGCWMNSHFSENKSCKT
jgi:hypothetical protein